MSNLFEISEEYKEKLDYIQILQRLCDETENEERKKDYIESIDLLIEQLDKIDIDLNNKFNNYANFIKSKETENEAIDKEIKRLKKLKNNNLSLISRLKGLMMINLKKLNKTVYKAFLKTISIRKNPPSVNIIDEHLVPIKYKEIVETIKIHKENIKKDLKTGKIIDGCELTQSERIDIK
jgi:soluble cytochrome b562